MTLKEHSIVPVFSVQLPVSKIEKDANYFCYFFLSSFLPGCRYEANDFGSGTNENFGSNRIRINNTSKESLFGSYVCENFILLFIKSRSQQSGSLTMQLRVVPTTLPHMWCDTISGAVCGWPACAGGGSDCGRCGWAVWQAEREGLPLLATREIAPLIQNFFVQDDSKTNKKNRVVESEQDFFAGTG